MVDLEDWAYRLGCWVTILLAITEIVSLVSLIF